MKKRLGLILGMTVMFSMVGCNITIQGNPPSTTGIDIEPIVITDSTKENIENPDTNQGEEQNNETGNEENTETKEIIVEGPEYATGYYQNQIGYGDDCAHLILKAGQIIILSPGYDELEASLNDVNNEIYHSVIEGFDNERYEELGGNNEWSAGSIWDDEMLVNVSRNDSQVFTLNSNYYAYLGGAHPYNSMQSYCFETATGKRLSLDDVINDRDALHEYLLEYLDAMNEGTLDIEYAHEYTGCLYEEWQDTIDEYFTSDERELHWYADEDGIVVYFNGYDIAPWTCGMISVPIKIADTDGILNEEYFHEAGTVEKRQESDCEYSEVIDNLYKPISEKILEWNYDDCIEYVDGFDYEYESHEPYEYDDNGYIELEDSENDYTFYVCFGEVDDYASEYSKETSRLKGVEYWNNDYNWVIMHSSVNGDAIYYYVILYSEYERFYFDSEEEMWKCFDYWTEK